MNRTLIAIAILLVIAVGGASLFFFPYNPLQPPKADDTGSTSEGVQQVVNANNKFAFELYKQLSDEEGNLFFSPYSISSALAITYEGAREKTADEIKNVFHFTDYDILRPNFAAIYNEINKGYRDYTLRAGNALWIQKDFPLLENYTTTVERYYGAKAANLDFVNEPEKSRQTINSFIEKQTNGKIEDLIPKDFITSSTGIVITNAIYFKGTWKVEFDPKETKEMDFHMDSNKAIKVQMMHMKPNEKTFNYTETEDVQILELPYKGDDISMLIILPKFGKLSEIEKKLTIEKLKEWKSKMRETELSEIYLPKFEIETKYFLEDTLPDMGMPTAFSPDADFSGMTGRRDLFISHVIHQAYVKVYEKGTEAAAATAVIFEKSMPAPEIIFKADHPFIFIIQQKSTGNILFIGRVVEPKI
ncbi:MAG: serpin family protein [Candidatus Aenigmarchaeota archaeon]|nr:serpin family protein [Candidatus Aenigmarchaeota archaeon]